MVEDGADTLLRTKGTDHLPRNISSKTTGMEAGEGHRIQEVVAEEITGLHKDEGGVQRHWSARRLQILDVSTSLAVSGNILTEN